jgi:hypothetical protein
MNVATGKGYIIDSNTSTQQSNALIRALWLSQLKENMKSFLMTLTESERRFIMNVS